MRRHLATLFCVYITAQDYWLPTSCLHITSLSSLNLRFCLHIPELAYNSEDFSSTHCSVSLMHVSENWQIPWEESGLKETVLLIFLQCRSSCPGWFIISLILQIISFCILFSFSNCSQWKQWSSTSHSIKPKADVCVVSFCFLYMLQLTNEFWRLDYCLNTLDLRTPKCSLPGVRDNNSL